MASRKVKIRYKRLLIFLLICVCFGFLVYKFLTLPITNIYVSGNKYFNDQYIIELSGLQNYPNAFFNFSNKIESKINENIYIKEVVVRKKWFTKIYIDVVENRPLFYDEINKKTVLLNGESSNDKFDIPILLNKIDDDIYNEFLEYFSKIDFDVFAIISEIKYVPNDVDNKLFLCTMKDGNYVYFDFDKIDSLNKYLDIVIQFNNRKGILYLNSGEYFKILDN